MDGLREWTLSLCTAALSCSLLRLLAPRDGSGKIYKLLLSVLFLCHITVPLLSFSWTFSGTPPVSPSAATTQRYREAVEQQIQATVSQQTEAALKERGVAVQKVAVLTDSLENGSIYIQQIRLYLDNKNLPQAMRVQELLGKELGCDVVLRSWE